MSADFISFAAPVDPKHAKQVLALLADETEYNGNVYLSCAVDEVFDLLGAEEEDGLAMSPNFPVFVAIDRFAADRQLLGGHAGRLVPKKELAAFAKQWEALKKKPGFVKSASKAVDRGWNPGDVESGIAAIDAAIARAQRQKLDLALLCCTA